MSKVAHTPGPWYVGRLDHHGQVIVQSEHIEVATCWHHSVGAIEKEMHANARLIAAAPGLLDALKACASVCAGDVMHKDGLIKALELARAAIAKAEAA